MQHTYSISGMTCQSCAEKIEKTLSDINSVTKVKIDLDAKKAAITMSQHIELSELNKALKPLKKYKLHMAHETTISHGAGLPKKTLKTYWPLILVILYILFGVGYLGWLSNDYTWKSLMPNFMGLFFLSFGFFKLLDIKGFAQSYIGYDIAAKAWPTWGYIYPFVEVGLGISFLFGSYPIWTNLITLVVMGVSIVGVIQSVLQKREIKCVCLGTGFNLPMSTVTIIEDAVMIVMAGGMLWVNLSL